MSHLKRDCPFFDHHVPLSRQTSNGTLFILYLEDGPVLTPLSPYCYIIFVKKKKSIYETHTKQYIKQLYISI